MKWLDAVTPRPALIVRPHAAASLDEAHLAIEQWEYYSRKQLDEAQRVAVELMMAETAGGRWAARTTGRAVARQNGKGDEVEVVEAWGLTQRGEAIVHTAHEIPTAKSAHERLVAHLESHRDLRRKIRGSPTYANGNQTIPMVNGGIVVYRTRTVGGGRGLDDISRLVIDEAQHAQPEQLASSTPILGANPNPQLNLIGTAGISEKSDWWWTIRVRALLGDDDGFAYLEHSAEKVELNRDGRPVSVRPDPNDHELWSLANPAFGTARLEESFLREQLRTLGPDLFCREHLCTWDPPTNSEGGVVPFDIWSGEMDLASTVTYSLTYGLSVSSDGAFAAVGSAGRRADGRLHIDVVRYQKGTGWVVEYLAGLYARRRVPIRINPSSTAGAFVQSLRDEGVEVVEVPSRDYQKACGAFLASVENEEVRHLGQEALDRAVAAATRRDVGHEGGWVWADSALGVDISPLKAATVALSGVARQRRAPRIHVLEEVG